MSDANRLAGTLFERHEGSVRRYLRALTGRADVAEDLAQDVFLRVVQHVDRYEARERDRAWLFRIARNAAIDHHRRSATRPQAAEGHQAVAPPAQPLQMELSEGLERLPDTERQAFLLAELAGLSYAEIAATLDVTAAAVRSMLYRARLSLRATLAPPSPLARTTSRTGQDDDD